MNIQGSVIMKLSSIKLYVVLFAIVLTSGLLILLPVNAALAASMNVKATSYSVPQGSDPWGTATNSKGNVWVAVPGCDPTPTCPSGTPPGKIEAIHPATGKWIQIRTLPAGYAQPFFLAFDQKGRLWFPLPMGNAIGMYNPSNGTFHQWTVPTPNAGPWDLAIDAQGNIWFTEHFVNQIGRFNPVTHTFTEIPTPASASQPYGITLDAAGNVWFTENNPSVALIAEYTTQGKLNEYKVRNSYDGGLTPHLITIDPNGNIWWTEGFVGMLGELHIAQAVPGTNDGVTEYAYPQLCSNCGMHTSGIGIDKTNGLIWFDDSLQNTYGSFPYSGTGSFTMYEAPWYKFNAHPHDGLMVDSQNTIWFDEEFTNKLAKVVYTP